MAFTNITQYLRPEFPVTSADEGSAGSEWEYIGPHADILANVPQVGDAWADGRLVTSWSLTPSIDNSGFSVLSISTQTTDNGSVATPVLEETRTQIVWSPQALPLSKHPVFAAAVGNDRTAMLGWEAELSPENRANYSYFKRDGNGVATGALQIVTNPLSIAYKYITLRLLGHENYEFHAPTWQVVDSYRGSVAPGTGTVGVKGDPPGTGWPPGWEWVSTADSAERQGRSNRWQRTRAWTGAIKIDYDVTQIFI
jgi:hypothetical protein